MTSENASIQALPRQEAIALAIKLLKFQVEIYPEINLIVKNLDIYPVVKQTWLEDEVFEKYEIESEDYCSIRGIERNKDFIETAGVLQKLIEKDILSYGPETMIYAENENKEEDEAQPIEIHKKGYKENKSFEEIYGEKEVVLDLETAKQKEKEKKMLDKLSNMKKDEDGRKMIEKAFAELFTKNKDQFQELAEMMKNPDEE